MDIDSINEKISFLYCGDSALTVQFGEEADIETNLKVRSLDIALKRNTIRGVTETIPTYRSEMVYYNPLIINTEDLIKEIKSILDHTDWNAVKPSDDVVVVPIYYRVPKSEIGSVAEYEKMSIDDVIRIHTNRYHYVFMMGVMPGFVYMSCPTGSFTIPRKAVPVERPYPNTIHIWSTHTAFSSFASNSGWHVIGRAPAPSYNPKRPEDPFLLQPGQWVKFREIDGDEYDYIEHEFLENRYQREMLKREPWKKEK